MSNVSQPLFYVYILSRPDGAVFYVGKGTGKRIDQHELEAQRGCSCHKCNVIRKIWRDGGEVRKAIVYRTTDERAALDYEIELIRYYGRENLTNLTDGGDGTSGRTISEEGRRRIGEANRTREHSLISRMKKRIASLGRVFSEETRDKIRQSRMGHSVSDETRAKVGAASRRRVITPEMRAHARAAQLGKKRSPETIERIRDRALNRSAETEERRRLALIAFNEQRRNESSAYQLMDELLIARWPVKDVVSRTGLSRMTVYRRKRELNV